MACQHFAAVLTKASIVVMLMVAMPACSDSPADPTDDTTTTQPPPTQPPPTPVPVELAEFVDPATGLSTSDVRDVHEQTVRFDRANSALIWAANDRSFPGYPVDGNFVRSDRFFQIRFGTKDGERRAYFTETVNETICDIEVVGSALMILPTSVRVPGT